MAAEIEAIREVASADAGRGAARRAPDPAPVTGKPAPRSRRPETEARVPAPEVGLVFEMDRESHDLIIKIVDRETGRVIREIPPEEIQRLRATMQSILGTVLDQTG